jgi:hypothetical protein
MMMAMVIINKAIRTRITRTSRQDSLTTTTMEVMQTINTVISKVVMDTMMNRKLSILELVSKLKADLDLADTIMPMPITHTSTKEGTMKVVSMASMEVNIKMSTTTTSTTTKEHLLLVSNQPMAKATPNKSAVVTRRKIRKLSAISP